jgi:hypothetical protein
MRKEYLSDQVWAHLDPRAARLTRTARIKVALWSLVAAALLFAALLVTASGLFIHRFTIKSAHTGGSFTSCWESVAIKNSGWFDDTIVTATLQPHGSGATLTRRVVELGLPSGGRRVIRLHYNGSFCRRMLTGPVIQNDSQYPDLAMHLRGPLGVSTATIRLAPPPSGEGLKVDW